MPNLKLQVFEVVRSTSFVSSLLPAMFLSRLVQTLRRKKAKPTAGLDISMGLNFLFEHMLNLEARLIRAGINFTLGGSRLVVAQKIEEA